MNLRLKVFLSCSAQTETKIHPRTKNKNLTTQTISTENRGKKIDKIFMTLPLMQKPIVLNKAEKNKLNLSSAIQQHRMSPVAIKTDAPTPQEVDRLHK